MPLKNVLVAIAGGLLLSAPAAAESLRLSVAGSSNPLPAVGIILDQQKELGLSSAQVEALERVGLDLLREGVRRQADLMIAQLDLSALLDRDPHEAIDVKNAEAKIRDMERIRSDLQVTFVRAVETAKNQLTAEQRAKLTALIAPERTAEADPPGQSDPADVVLAAGHAPPGGAHPRPPGGAHPRPPGGKHPRPPSGGHPFHRDHGSRVIIGIRPFWWGDLYPYWGYPVPPPIVVEPPAYIEQPPAAPPAYWYYCPSAGAYYPAVETCPEPWILVAPGAG